MEKDIYSKLFEFKQKEITLTKDTQGHNYKYATLKQIQDKLGPVFKELNLIVIHSINNGKVVTEIRDLESKTFIKSEIDIGEVKSARNEKFVDKNGKDVEITESNSCDPQGVGSIISYYRRYNLLALLDLEQEDDDSSSGSNKAKAKTYETADIYVMTQKDVENWNGKVYGKSVYVNGEKKIISDEQIKKLMAHEKYIETPKK